MCARRLYNREEGKEEGYCVGQGKFDIQKREGEGSVAFGRNFTETSASFG